MSLDIFISDTNEIEMDFVCRNFNVGDKVHVCFKDKFYNGKVVKKEIRENIFGFEPYLFVKTKEKVDNETDALFNGYGIRGWASRQFYFEDEPLPEGNTIYRKRIRRPATPKEIAEYNEPFPF